MRGETAGLRTHPPSYPREPQDPGWVLPFKRLMGMCCWMESRFHGWTDYNGVANFSSGPGLAPVYVHGLCLDPSCPTKHLPVNNGNTESALKIAIICAFRPLRNVDQRETSAKVVYVVCHKRFRCEQDAKFGAITRSSILKIVQFNHASLE